MHKEEPKMGCPIFLKHEPMLKGIADKINKAKEIQAKARLAEELQKEVDVLLSSHDVKKIDCKNCRTIANVYRKTAGLIIKAQKLA